MFVGNQQAFCCGLSVLCRFAPNHLWDIDDDEDRLVLLQMYKGFTNDLESNNCFINAVLQVNLWIPDS